MDLSNVTTRNDERRTSNMNNLWMRHNAHNYSNELCFYVCQLSFEHKILYNALVLYNLDWVSFIYQKWQREMMRKELHTWITYECDITHIKIQMNCVSMYASYRLSSKICITHFFYIWDWVLWSNAKCQQKMKREELQTWITFECDITHLKIQMNSVQMN